ncbi:MAG: hypothetical protein AB7K71_36320 [Polyangiaceae bacterium]
MRWFGAMTWLVLCACSREEHAAVDAAVDARDAPSASPPRSQPSLTPSASATPAAASSDPVDSTNPWERCRTGYVPLGEPSRDVLQLGLMCGPSTGMRPLEQLSEGSAPGETTKALEGKTGECFRVVFAAQPPVSVTFTWSTAAAHVGESKPARLVGPKGLAFVSPGSSALCLSAPGDLALRLETRGSGRYAYQILKRR